VTAAAPCELLELTRVSIERLGRSHPRVRDVLRDYAARRVTDPQAAAKRKGAS
jgi:hypothetical protein